MRKICSYVPIVIRCLGLIGVVTSLVFAILSLAPDKVEKDYSSPVYNFGVDVDEVDYETYVVPNPYSIYEALGIFASSIFVIGFASIVEAAEQYLSQFRYNEEDTSEE